MTVCVISALWVNVSEVVISSRTQFSVLFIHFLVLDVKVQDLILSAIEARKQSYCPYSKFAVGAAIRTIDGSIYNGCNIENACFTAGVCAEITAAAKAVR